MGVEGDFPGRKQYDPPYWFRSHFREQFPDIARAALQEAGDE
jgi:hypothetical protein